jgi:hypothetical protein
MWIRSRWLIEIDSGKEMTRVRDFGRNLGMITRTVEVPAPVAMLLILLICLVDSRSNSMAAPLRPDHQTPSQSAPVREDDSKKCLEAARKELGPDGIVLRCGHLIGGAGLEAVVAVRVLGLKDDGHGIPISSLKVLRENGHKWDSQLNVDREVMNGAGYLGVNFIYDAHLFPYHRVTFTDHGAKWGARTASQFTLILFSIDREGRLEPGDVGLGIGWNAAVGRFQEIEPNGEDFAPEVKAPKHIKGQ